MNCYNHVIFRCVTSTSQLCSTVINADIISHNRILARDKLFGRKKDAFILEF